MQAGGCKERGRDHTSSTCSCGIFAVKHAPPLLRSQPAVAYLHSSRYDEALPQKARLHLRERPIRRRVVRQALRCADRCHTVPLLTTAAMHFLPLAHSSFSQPCAATKRVRRLRMFSFQAVQSSKRFCEPALLQRTRSAQFTSTIVQTPRTTKSKLQGAIITLSSAT